MNVLILSNTANVYFFNMLKACVESYNNKKYKTIVVETNKKLIGKDIPINADFIFPDGGFNYNKFLNEGLKAIRETKFVISNNDVIYEPGCMEEIETKLDIFDSVTPQDLNTHTGITEDTVGTKVGYHVLGCCIALNKNTLNRIGAFDEAFKFWYQDNDYCNNLKKYKLKHALLSKAKIRHLKAQSHVLIKDKLFEMTHGLEQPLKEKWREYEDSSNVSN
jgi:hypothetical protein